jgi:hypothetical protein
MTWIRPQRQVLKKAKGQLPQTGMACSNSLCFGKPLVDAAVKAIAQTSNYLHAMSCLFTNAAIQYK